MQLVAQAVSVRFGGLVAVDQVSISLKRKDVTLRAPTHVPNKM